MAGKKKVSPSNPSGQTALPSPLVREAEGFKKRADPAEADLQLQVEELKSEVREVLALLRAEKAAGGRKAQGPKAQEPEAAKVAVKRSKKAAEPAPQAEALDFDPALRVRHRFYYVTLQAPPGACGGNPAEVEELLSRNFARLCRRGSYEVGAAVASFSRPTLTLHAVLRASRSLPTTSAALANCNRTTLRKAPGAKVDYYVEGISLRPLNKGKGSYMTQEVLRAAVAAVDGEGPAAAVAGDKAELFAEVPFEVEVDTGKRGVFNRATRGVSYPAA